MTTTHRISTGVVLALALGTSATAVSARSFDLNGNGSYVPARTVNTQATSQLSETGGTTIASHGFGIPGGGAPPVVPVASTGSGFHWDDEGSAASLAPSASVTELPSVGALQERHHRRRAAASDRASAGVRKPDLEMRSSGDANDPGPNGAHHLTRSDMAADRQLVGRPGVTVIDIAVAGERGVAVQHRRRGPKATDAVQHDRA
jgi:hypothetical protein